MPTVLASSTIQYGIAVILHALAMLKALGMDNYGVITVVIRPDEEVGSLAECDLRTKLGTEHGVVRRRVSRCSAKGES